MQPQLGSRLSIFVSAALLLVAATKADESAAYKAIVAQYGAPTHVVSSSNGSTHLSYDNVNYNRIFAADMAGVDPVLRKQWTDYHVSFSADFTIDANGRCSSKYELYSVFPEKYSRPGKADNLDPPGEDQLNKIVKIHC